MDEAVSKLRDNLKIIMEYINKKQHLKLEAESYCYDQKISNFKKKFNKFSEKTTPEFLLSKMYKCEGRLKFYADKTLFIYLEVEENKDDEIKDSNDNCHGSSYMWPVMFTWKIEIVRQLREIFTLGQASYVFNKPRQGFVALPNDWIAIKLDKIIGTDLIAKDGSATLRWTVVSKPVLQIETIDEFKKILEDLQRFCDNYEGPEEQLNYIMKKFNEHGDKLTSMDGKLSHLETMMGNFKEQLEEFKNHLKVKVEH